MFEFCGQDLQNPMIQFLLKENASVRYKGMPLQQPRPHHCIGNSWYVHVCRWWGDVSELSQLKPKVSDTKNSSGCVLICHKVKIQIEWTWEDHVTLSIYPKNSQFVGKLEKDGKRAQQRDLCCVSNAKSYEYEAFTFGYLPTQEQFQVKVYRDPHKESNGPSGVCHW